MTAAASRERPARAPWLQRCAAFGFANAGRTYNSGNALALAAAVLTAAGEADPAGLFASLARTFAGSPPAVAMSAGSLAFFLSGAAYDRAHRPAAGLDEGYFRLGNALSALGATAMAFGVAELATTRLALTLALAGGALHVGGKLAAACGGQSGVWRVLPLLSRALAFVSLTADVALDPKIAHMAGSALLAACLIIWARADALLLTDRQALGLAAALGLSRKAPEGAKAKLMGGDL